MAERVDGGAQSLADERWMRLALELARSAVGRASPNPTVGCVIVREGRLVGAGAHEYARRDHAEIAALREAGDLARGATAYVTLEPCSHHGRTGPCADALIAAGVSRVVAATLDANPAVHGLGAARLRAAGVEVAVGVAAEKARRLNDSFAKYIRTGLPFVTLKAAMTLDGRIAPAASARTVGEISWITGAESRAHVQSLRHSVDAVITGIGTVLADDPLLTDRSGSPRRRPLMRVVLDSKLRLPLDSKLCQSADGDVVVFCSEPSPDRLAALSERGVDVRAIAAESGETRASLAQILKALGEMQIASAMVEAGSELNANFLKAGLVDRLFLFYAPWFLGADGVPMSQSGAAPESRVLSMRLHRFGDDFACEAWLQGYWDDGQDQPSSVSATSELASSGTHGPESARLAQQWGSGTFPSIEASLLYHFAEHGSQVGAASMPQYLRKADRFVANLGRSQRTRLPDGSIRYTKNGRYAIKSAEGKILSFGSVTP